MQVNIITNKRDLDVFVSKRAKKKCREYIKQFNYGELKKYWHEFLKEDLTKYFKELVDVKSSFSNKEKSITLQFEIFESQEEKDKLELKKKVKAKLRKMRHKRNNKGQLDQLEDEIDYFNEETKVAKDILKMYINACKKYPKMYIPDPIDIQKKPRDYLMDLVEYIQENEEDDKTNSLYRRFNPYVVYMSKMIDF